MFNKNINIPDILNLTDRNIEFKDLGKITFHKSPGARKISISIRPFEGIRVTVPVYVSYRSAERFIEKKESWLRKNLAKINYAEKSFTVFDFETVFHTNEHSLKIIRSENELIRVKIHDSEILVFCPFKRNIRDKEIQQMIRWGIETAWRKEAIKYLPARLGELARTNGFEFSRISIKNNKSRWGSCSGTNNINLSLHLMRLPKNLSDYVMLHELAHTVHKNHSKEFWSHLDAITGNAKGLDKELKKYRIEIY